MNPQQNEKETELKTEDIQATVAFALLVAATVLFALHAVDYLTGALGGKTNLLMPAIILAIAGYILKALAKKNSGRVLTK
jgi:hypothetical protein